MEALRTASKPVPNGPAGIQNASNAVGPGGMTQEQLASAAQKQVRDQAMTQSIMQQLVDLHTKLAAAEAELAVVRQTVAFFERDNRLLKERLLKLAPAPTPANDVPNKEAAKH